MDLTQLFLATVKTIRLRLKAQRRSVNDSNILSKSSHKPTQFSQESKDLVSSILYIFHKPYTFLLTPRPSRLCVFRNFETFYSSTEKSTSIQLGAFTINKLCSLESMNFTQYAWLFIADTWYQNPLLWPTLRGTRSTMRLNSSFKSSPNKYKPCIKTVNTNP